MSRKALLPLPWLFAGAFAAAGLVTGDASLPTLLAIENESGKVLAVIGTFAAALAFERGEYLSRAWSMAGACFVLLLAADAVGSRPAAAALGAHQIGLFQGLLVVLANTCSVVATFMLARAWTVAGLEDDAERARRRTLFAGALALSLAVTGWPLVHDVRDLAGGDLGATVSIASDVGDTICLALVAPVMRTALALRGGLLLWPWGFLTASGLAWIAYDASSGILDALQLGRAHWLVASEALRALACGFYLVAGLAQRMASKPESAAVSAGPETAE